MVFLPALLFFGILSEYLCNLPLFDDYRALLNYLNAEVQTQGVSGKLSYFLASQHNEYKLFFEHAVVWLNIGLAGHLDFRFLCMLGNCFVLVLAVQLWKMFLPDQHGLNRRLIYFIPVSWLLFQLEYVETVDWAMGSLQNLPVIVFSFGSIILLSRPGLRSFLGSMACLALAVGSSGNGFVVIPVGLLMLVRSHRYRRIIPWMLVSAGTLAAYAYRYNFMSSQSPHSQSIFSTLMHIRFDYILAFLGSAAGHPEHAGPFVRSLIVGLLLCAFYVVVWWQGYFRKRPVVAHCVLFLFITGVGVAGIRSDLGLMQSLSSRYAIYSDLLLIFAWFAIVEESLLPRPTAIATKRMLIAVITTCVLFGLAMDVIGWRSLVRRDSYLVESMTRYQHSSSSHPDIGPLLPLPGQDKHADSMDQTAGPILERSEALGIYRPPVF